MLKQLLIGLGSFLVFGGVANALPKVTMAGDYGCTTTAFGNTLDNIQAQAPDLHIAVGDLGYQECTARNWCVEVRARAPLEIIIGNHDTSEELSYLFSCPSEMHPTGIYGRQSYFDLGGARFITADPAIEPSTALEYVSGPKRNWLENTIAEAKNEGLWVVVMTHKLCIAAGGHGCEIGEDFLDRMVAWGVDLVWHGHAHNYQRSKQLYDYSNCDIRSYAYDSDCVRATSNYPHYPAGGTHVIINGTGGRPMTNYQIDPNQPDYPYFRETDDESHGPTTLYIGAESLHVKQVTNADGTIDEFWIDR